jgi:hypothetical protein
MARNQPQQLGNYLSTGALIVLASLVPPLSLPALSQTPKLPQSKPIRVSKAFSWGDVLNLLAPRRRQGASRDPLFCWVSMSDIPSITNRVATDSPIFYWQSDAYAIGVRIMGENRPFWKKSTADIQTPGIRQIRYDGSALESGVDYELVVYSSKGGAYKIANFQVLSSEEQVKLRDQLKPLKGKDNATLLKRIAIYNNHQLTTDAVTELLAVRSPSMEVRQTIEQIPEQWCPKPES